MPPVMRKKRALLPEHPATIPATVGQVMLYDVQASIAWELTTPFLIGEALGDALLFTSTLVEACCASLAKPPFGLCTVTVLRMCS